MTVQRAAGAFVAALLTLASVACDDPTSPLVPPDACSAVHACLTPGPDVEVVAITLETPATDAVSGLPVSDGGTVRATVLVRNRGSIASAPGELVVELEKFAGRFVAMLPVLQPGEELSTDAVMVADGYYLLARRDERTTVTARATVPNDTVRGNDARTTGTFILGVPLLEIRGTAGAARAGGSLPLTLTVRNFSSVADAAAGEWVACLGVALRPCGDAGLATSGAFTLPRVDAASAISQAFDVPLPPESVFLDQAADYTAFLCRRGSDICVPVSQVRVSPEYEAVCAPPRLDGGVAVSLPGYNCGNPHLARTPQRPPPFHIVSLAAQAGVTYRVERGADSAPLRLYDAGGIPVPDLDAAPDRIRVGEATRVYIVTYSAAGTATFRATPTTQVTP